MLSDKTSTAKAAPSLAKTLAQTAVKILVAVGLIYWMIHKGLLNFDAFRTLMTPKLVIFTFSCILFQIVINNYRWLILLRAQGFHTGVRATLPLSFISMFFSFVMPGGVGGDVIKGYYLMQEHPHKKVSGAISIFMDRLFGFFVMITTAVIALAFNWSSVSQSPQLKSVALAVSALFLAFIVFFAIAFSRRLGHQIFDSPLGNAFFVKLPGGQKIRQIYDSVHSYREHPRAVFLANLMSFITQLPSVAFIYAIALAMGVTEVPLPIYFFIVPVGIVVLALPISPAGIGVGQAAFYFLFSLYLGRESQVGPTAVTVLQVVNFMWGLVGAFFYLRRRKPTVAEGQLGMMEPRAGQR